MTGLFDGQGCWCRTPGIWLFGRAAVPAFPALLGTMLFWVLWPAQARVVADEVGCWREVIHWLTAIISGRAPPTMGSFTGQVEVVTFGRWGRVGVAKCPELSGARRSFLGRWHGAVLLINWGGPAWHTRKGGVVTGCKCVRGQKFERIGDSSGKIARLEKRIGLGKNFV